MNMKRLSNKEIRSLNSLAGVFNISFKKGSEIYVIKIDDVKIFVMNKQPIFFYFGEKLLPTLNLILQEDNIYSLFPKVVVDMGAVRFVLNGADIMRPGIVSIDTFSDGDFILVVDVKYKKPLAIGRALFDSEKMKTLDSGKVVQNIHYLNDKIWNAVN
jgi:PUA-domain protein